MSKLSEGDMKEEKIGENILYVYIIKGVGRSRRGHPH
jgi:hypothetical protein